MNASTGRLAPSPTGHLHLGHARSFLVAWWHARSRGGSIVLRLEDLDVDRVKPGMIDATLEDLRWLGLDWDGEPHVQSQGLARIEAAADELVRLGHAYPCVCSRAEIAAAQSAPHASEAVYPGTCRGRFATLDAAERATGRPAALRFLAPDAFVKIEDGIAGTLVLHAARDLGDFPILRRSKAPAYQLAVVVDDAWQRVTEVVRGADLLESAARQRLLQQALGIQSPRWWHVPLVTDAEGRRYAKRSDDVSLARLRREGVAPQTVVAWVARRSGVACGASSSAKEVLSHFTIERLPREPVRLAPSDLAELGIA